MSCRSLTVSLHYLTLPYVTLHYLTLPFVLLFLLIGPPPARAQPHPKQPHRIRPVVVAVAVVVAVVVAVAVAVVVVVVVAVVVLVAAVAVFADVFPYYQVLATNIIQSNAWVSPFNPLPSSLLSHEGGGGGGVNQRPNVARITRQPTTLLPLIARRGRWWGGPTA